MHVVCGEIEEFVDESDFACDSWFDQDAMAASDHAHNLEVDKLPDGLYRATIGTLFEYQNSEEDRT